MCLIFNKLPYSLLSQGDKCFVGAVGSDSSLSSGSLCSYCPEDEFLVGSDCHFQLTTRVLNHLRKSDSWVFDKKSLTKVTFQLCVLYLVLPLFQINFFQRKENNDIINWKVWCLIHKAHLRFWYFLLCNIHNFVV